jgi:CheY-like chemotaxis protein
MSAILHVEDDPLLVELVRSAFGRFGFRGAIVSVDNVPEALERIEAMIADGDPPSLILVDMQLREGSGLDLVRQVKTQPGWATIPILVLSNQGDPKEVTEAYALGANCYLSKNASGKDLIDSLSALYRVWCEYALLPNAASTDRARETLMRAVSLRARTSDLYTRLARSFAGEPDVLEFWLNLALNEGNQANLLAFFDRQFSEADAPPEALDRIRAFQTTRERRLREAEAHLAQTDSPSLEDAYRWALQLESLFDEGLYAEALALLFPLGPAATTALRDHSIGHLLALATGVLRDCADAGLRAQAEDLRERVGRFQEVEVLDDQ